VYHFEAVIRSVPVVNFISYPHFILQNREFFFELDYISKHKMLLKLSNLENGKRKMTLLLKVDDAICKISQI